MNLGKDPRSCEIPEDLLNQAEEHARQMVEQIAELDDDLTMKYLEGEEITVEELKAALRTGSH